MSSDATPLNTASRAPAVVSIERLNSELAPLDPGLTPTQQLEHAFAYVSALLNSQLALDYVRNSRVDNKPTISPAMAVLVPLATFILGALTAMGAISCYFAATKGQSGPADAKVVRFGQNQIGIVIETSEGVVKGTRHQVEPPKC